MQSHVVTAPSLVLAGNYTAEHLFSSLDAFLESPMWLPRKTSENTAMPVDPDADSRKDPFVHKRIRPLTTASAADKVDVRLHLDLRRCTREHRLGDALALVQYLAGRVGQLDVTVSNELQGGFGEVLTVIGKSHGLKVSVQ